MINWKNLIDVDVATVQCFAANNLSGRTFYNAFRNTPVGGVARSALRKYGTTYARRVARKALRRRNLI